MTTPEHRVTREDLIQVEYELYSMMVSEYRRQFRVSFDHRVAEHLGSEGSGWVHVGEQYDPPLDDAIALLVGTHLRRHASELAGAQLKEAAGWKRLTIGDRVERIADSVTGFCDAGTLLDTPAVVSTWMNQQRRQVRVTVPFAQEDAAHDFLRALEDSARGPSNPWRFQVLDAQPVGAGISFETRPLADLDPGPLWFPNDVSDLIAGNVIAAVKHLGALREAGLGSNRGILISGPPGVGKTALCRRTALELRGRATVVLVSAQVGRWQIPRLYEELQYLAPAVVFLEDLDLLVGDRDDRSAGEGLIDFLTVLDGLMTRHHEVITVATSNDPDAIDAAAMRAGRFDVTLELGTPDEHARKQILQHFLARIVPDEVIDYDAIVSSTAGATGADLREIIRRAYLASNGADISTDALVAAAASLAFPPATISQTATAPARASEAGQYL